ncbi:hypothetical protein D9757_005920 [Collybiopsis confluens]|uniref:Myb-like domain-containing protein n=1 Tax=Collybiopsis confluens TaxID=2823264 RepID=A0A8H5HNQ6_9AGAR|nr:hypothetical protein D9757_005920 [Collybiopsis confluens]
MGPLAECAKRWTDTLDPTIDRSGWHPEQDQILLDAVKLHGTCWKNIVRTYFPGKTGLSAKNRYTSLTRMQNLSRRPQRVRARSAEDDGQSSSSHTSNESQLPSLHTPPLKQEESWPRHTYSPLHSSSNHPDWEISSSPHAEPHCHHSHSFSTPSYESRPLYSVESSTTYWSTHPTSSTRRQASYSDYDYNTYLSYHSSSSSVVPFSREHGSFYGSSHHSFLPQHPSYRMQDGPYAFHTW